MKKTISVFQGLVLILGYLLCVLLATWDRPEAMAPYVLVLALAGVLWALVWFFLERVALGWFDALVVIAAGCFAWRAWESPVALYGQTDLILILSALLLWFGVSTIAGRQPAIVKRVWLAVMLVMLGCNVAASWYQLNVDQSWCLFVERTEGNVVGTGVFTHYNYFGNFAAVAALSCLGMLFGKSVGLMTRIVAGIVVVGNLVLLGMCASRGAFVSAAAGMAVFFVFYAIHLWNSRKLKKPLAAGGLLLLVIVVVSAGYSQFGRLDASRGWTAHEGQTQDSGRKDFSALAVDQFMEAPAFGLGAHSVEWRSVSLQSRRGGYALGTLNYAHNEYFQVLCDYGLAGFILLFSLILSYGGVLVFSLLKREDVVWGMAVFAAFVAFCVHCLFSFPAHIPANLLTIVVVCALGWRRLKFEAGLGRWLLVIPVLLSVLTSSAYAMYFGWKELPAFKVYSRFNETMELSDWEPELREQAAALAAVNERAPNFKREWRLGEMYGSLFEKSANLVDYKQSGEHYLRAAALYPMSPNLRLTEASFLAASDEYAKAEESYEFVLENGVSQRRWLYLYWKYGLYCYQRGDSLWLEREGAQALVYFKKAQELFGMARPPREAQEELRAMKRELAERIRLLERVL
ncbi:O-antigen ligase family protein [Rubritalea sp.]|uniref:O-antigen ligase family protein n=1 Tax=Rubritalea sp. TaxID=2109375 RepID=UPI003EF25EB9